MSHYLYLLSQTLPPVFLTVGRLLRKRLDRKLPPVRYPLDQIHRSKVPPTYFFDRLELKVKTLLVYELL